MIFHTIRRIALLSALLILAGCYETDFAVIEAGAEVPGLAGSYSAGGEKTVVIKDMAGTPTSKGFEYLLRTETGDELELLADKVQDDLWLVQLGRVGDDGAMRYLFLFLGKDGDNFVFKLPNLVDENGAAEILAAEHGIEIVKEQTPNSNEIRLLARGTPDAIHAFLRAHPGQVELKDMTPIVPQ